ncbi:hypothetical protein HPB51_018233 [Rhipicephalus microplus]|uniref:Uncharacterized protein n=1 Tax=Rhipicephalus microplus TaxID=6941 RepID=A0A9J6E2R9_RHIMP|nr:hypothetical protein HPB51_018233 [Rhipicephalus microplus]
MEKERSEMLVLNFRVQDPMFCYSGKAQRLTDITRNVEKNKTRSMNKKQALGSLRTALSLGATVKASDLKRESVLRPDASEYGMSAIHMQENRGFLQPVSYACR